MRSGNGVSRTRRPKGSCLHYSHGPSALSRHRRKYVLCAGMGVPVLKMTASPRPYPRNGHAVGDAETPSSGNGVSRTRRPKGSCLLIVMARPKGSCLLGLYRYGPLQRLMPAWVYIVMAIVDHNTPLYTVIDRNRALYTIIYYNTPL